MGRGGMRGKERGRMEGRGKGGGGREERRERREGRCAAKAFYSCPAIISRCPVSQNTSKESQLNSEKDSRRKQARSHVTLEKSS